MSTNDPGGCCSVDEVNVLQSLIWSYDGPNKCCCVAVVVLLKVKELCEKAHEVQKFEPWRCARMPWRCARTSMARIFSHAHLQGIDFFTQEKQACRKQLQAGALEFYSVTVTVESGGCTTFAQAINAHHLFTYFRQQRTINTSITITQRLP